MPPKSLVTRDYVPGNQLEINLEMMMQFLISFQEETRAEIIPFKK